MDLYDLFFLGDGGGSPSPQPTLISKNISSNGTYSASEDDADGYYQVVVAVSGISIDSESLTPLEFGCDSGGFYFSDTAGTGNGFGFGRDSTGIYAQEVTTNG